jgi:hypothetical protein
VAIVAALLATVGLAFLGWSLLVGGPKPVTPRAQALPEPSASARPTLPSPVNEKALPILSARDYDPLGNGTENADLTALAIDKDPGTAWSTVQYRADYLSGKAGVGLLLDLGTPRPVNAVALSLVGRGSDVAILTADTVPTSPTGFAPFAKAVGAPENITMRAAKPRVARYVLVWFTRIPPLTDGGYQGGLSTVKVLG